MALTLHQPYFFPYIGCFSLIGSGAVISNNITIGKNCMIGAGSVVPKDIPLGCSCLRKSLQSDKEE